jgi:Pyruvate/2-oxoacid:ferredoxin oxidoreductase delta subunit
MTLFKAVKKPLIRNTSAADSRSSSFRPRYTPKDAPCAADCPIGCDVRGMLTTIGDAEADGRTPEQALVSAWQRITARNPFPSVCGRICSRPCEGNCYRGRKEGAVAVRAVERFVGDYAVEKDLKFARPKALPSAVAVIGAGPAGLSAAYHLARRGYTTTVFESSAEPGGAMRSGVSAVVLDSEIRRILDLGVELKCGCGEIAAEALRGGFAAVLETADLEPADPSSVAVAIARGMAAAADADATLRGVAPAQPAPRPLVPPERIRLEWYKNQPRLDEAGELTATIVRDEARRCMSCGMCMGCGNCWMYCTKGGFEKVATGRRYKLNLERCNGCGKCMDGCPSGYIDLA